MDYSPPGFSAHGILLARILELVAIPFSRGSSQQEIEPRSPALRADSLPTEPPGKPKNTGVRSLSLLRQSNLGFLHCRQIPYQLSYQGSPAFVGVGPQRRLSAKELHSKRQVQTGANQRREGMQKEGRSCRKTIAQPWGRVLVPARGIRPKNISLSTSAGTWHSPLPQGGRW